MFHHFFERSGRFFFQQMRLPFFLLLLGIGPLFSGFLLFYERESTEVFQNQFLSIAKKAKKAFEKKERKEWFLAVHKNSDPYFLDKEIESLSFLEQEKARLKNWMSHPALSNKDSLKERLHFLESDQNRISFVEAGIQISNTFKETLEKQRESVEIDQGDLKRLLSLIEEQSLDPEFLKTNRPQLVICDFSLSKKSTVLQNEVFDLKMDILKREF